MGVSEESVRRFVARFRGLTRAYGTYLTPMVPVPGQKAEAKRWTKRDPVTDDLYGRHLNGVAGLGITPIMDNDKCWWGALDVDDYNLDLPEWVGKVEALGLPLVVCRSKSGGAHSYLFTSEPVPAALMRNKLKEWAKALGLKPSTEIFPKQDRLSDVSDDAGCGSWINLPYYDCAKTLRYAHSPEDAGSLTLDEFLDLADKRAVSVSQLAQWETVADLPPEPDTDTSDEGIFWGGPPCLNTICQEKVRPGFRNEVMLNIAIYYKKVDPATVEEKTTEAGRNYFSPPLSSDESKNTIRGVLKREYNYRCKSPPLSTHCDRKLCQTRLFGVSSDKSDGDGRLPIGGTVKLAYGKLRYYTTEPPVWRWDINGFDVQFDTEQLTSQSSFLNEVLKTTRLYGAPMKSLAWSAFISTECENAEKVVVPADAMRSGHAKFLLRQFCTGGVTARSMDELPLGKPFTTADKHMFIAADFQTYCQSKRAMYTEQELFFWLTTLGLEVQQMVIKGKSHEIWIVPKFDEQTMSFDVPRDLSSGGF